MCHASLHQGQFLVDHRVDAQAYGLIDTLRTAGALTLSLVAVKGESIVGHVAFRPVTISSPTVTIDALLGLAPLAVVPTQQRTGIGSRIFAAGLLLEACGTTVYGVVVVLTRAALVSWPPKRMA